MAKSTKQDILDALLVMLQDRSLDEITVKDLTEHCGISRQAFYYHFSDIYSVVDWGLQLELQRVDVTEDWAILLESAEDRLMKHRTIVLNVYRAFMRSYAAHYLRSWLRPVIEVQVRKTAANYQVTEDQISLVIDLFTSGSVDMALNWMDQGMPPGRTRLKDVRYLLDGSADYMLGRLAQRDHPCPPFPTRFDAI